MRFFLSALVSIDVHIWALALAVLSWPQSGPVAEPDPMEVQIVRLPALPKPGDGGELIERGRRHISPPKYSGPTVEYRVSISKSTSLGPVDLASSEDADFVLRQVAKASVAQEFKIPPGFNTKPVRDDNEQDMADMDPGGDQRPLVQIIQARIDEVTPLIHRTSGDCRFEEGIMKIRFRISHHGYTADKRIVNSSGPSCLDEVAEKILHMAEPYPYVAGWVPVTIRFTL